MKEILCERCSNPLPVQLARKACKSYRPRFCNQICFQEWRRESGKVLEWAKAANAAQHVYKSKHGEVPGYEHRRAALVQSNQDNPRRRKLKGEQP